MNQPEDLASRIRELEQRIAILEGAPRAAHTSVRDGSFDVLDSAGRLLTRLDGTGVHTYDASGVEQARFGNLTAGGYGMEVVRAGVPVSLADYVFGSAYASIFTQETTSSTSIVDLATVGPSVTVTVGASGKVLVLGGADIAADSGSPTNAQAAANVYLVWSGANTGGPAAWSSVMGVLSPPPATQHYIEASAANGRVLSGLNPGSTTFKLRYANLTTGGSANFSSRWIYAQPL